MYERFTDRARRVMALSQQEAQLINHEYVGTEHILLGLIKEGSGVAANVLRNLGLNFQDARIRVCKLVKPGPEMVTMGKLPQTPQTKKIMEQAIEAARELNHNYVGTEHILLGILRISPEAVAPTVLREMGITETMVKEEVINLLGVSPEQSANLKPVSDSDAVYALMIKAGMELLDAMQPMPEDVEALEREARRFFTCLKGRLEGSSHAYCNKEKESQ